MALFSLNMLEIAGELAIHDQLCGHGAEVRQPLRFHRFGHQNAGSRTGMWDEEDGFFYDVLQLPNGEAQRLKVRRWWSFALLRCYRFEGEFREKFPEIMKRLKSFLQSRPEFVSFIHDPCKQGQGGRGSAPFLMRPNFVASCLKCSTKRNSSAPTECAPSPGITPNIPMCSMSGNRNIRVSYLPGDSDTGMFGGNSNWRGPIWMPVNALIVRALLQYYLYYGNDFTVECPTGSGHQMNLYQVARGNLAAANLHLLEEIKTVNGRSMAPRTSSGDPYGGQRAVL